jgi:hypothetical protein
MGHALPSHETLDAALLAAQNGVTA